MPLPLLENETLYTFAASAPVLPLCAGAATMEQVVEIKRAQKLQK